MEYEFDILYFIFNILTMRDSIRKIVTAVKRYADNRELLLAALIILIGFGSFGLGRLSKIEEEKEPVFITHPQVQTGTVLNTAIPQQTDKKFIASKNGTKYHHPWCSGAQRIKEGNQVWFKTKGAAESAGYTPAKNCKGL